MYFINDGEEFNLFEWLTPLVRAIYTVSPNTLISLTIDNASFCVHVTFGMFALGVRVPFWRVVPFLLEVQCD